MPPERVTSRDLLTKDPEAAFAESLVASEMLVGRDEVGSRAFGCRGTIGRGHLRKSRSISKSGSQRSWGRVTHGHDASCGRKTREPVWNATKVGKSDKVPPVELSSRSGGFQLPQSSSRSRNAAARSHRYEPVTVSFVVYRQPQ